MVDVVALYQTLARKRTACGALFIEDRKLLLVKPTYKPMWEIPGGIAEALESPKTTCLRECREELGIEVQLSHMAVIDWREEPVAGAHDSLQILFMGLPLTEQQKAAIVLPDHELSEWAYVPFDEALERLHPHIAERLKLVLGNLDLKTAIYCENGVRI